MDVVLFFSENGPQNVLQEVYITSCLSCTGGGAGFFLDLSKRGTEGNSTVKWLS